MSDTPMTQDSLDRLVLNSTDLQFETSGSTGSGPGNTGNRALREGNPCKRYCFTWNTGVGSNVPEMEWIENTTSLLYEFLIPLCKVFIAIPERGDEENRLHWQGYLVLKGAKKRFTTLKRLCPEFKDISWRCAKGNRAQNMKYCTKDIHKGIFPEHRIYIGCKAPYQFKLESLYDWQQEVWMLLSETPSNRILFWIYDLEGNTGKSAFTKHVVVNSEDALVVNGKASDIMYAVQKNLEENGKYYRTIIMDVPRSMIGDDSIKISYGGLEKIKDMCFFSGKYEGGMVVGPNPHLIVFANCRPDANKFSRDRVVLREIVGRKLEHREY